jgi:tetratricopeptide (TPR) repeat protein
MRLEDPEQRFALYYALQESARRITESPIRALEFAEAVLRAHRPALRDETSADAEAMLPWLDVEGQAHLLAAQADLWLKEFSNAQSHLIAAYRDLARGGDETALAVVELTESQRRSFLGEGEAALILARRARATFEERGLEDFSARAAVAEGLALVTLGRFEAALPAYRGALQTFERFELWNNYVGAVNSLATALYRLGRLDEARREFARVLRRLSRPQHRSWLGYLRQGLGDILFSAGRFREAAISFDRASQLYEECGLRASALIARLAEAESWARYGNSSLSSSRLNLVARFLSDDRSLDPSAMSSITQALARAMTNSDEIANLRQQIPRLLSKSQR